LFCAAACVTSSRADDRDVGILELSTPTTAIQLATSFASLFAGYEVVIAGWA
jgi:hypothetical protein